MDKSTTVGLSAGSVEYSVEDAAVDGIKLIGFMIHVRSAPVV